MMITPNEIAPNAPSVVRQTQAGPYLVSTIKLFNGGVKSHRKLMYEAMGLGPQSADEWETMLFKRLRWKDTSGA